MKILFIGDIVARAGRNTMKTFLPEILRENNPDFVFANAENLTHGDGFSDKHIGEMRELGIDYFSAGDHTWSVKSGREKLDEDEFSVIRPANYPEGVPGRGYKIVKNAAGQRVLFINLIGRVFMKKDYDCPFKKVDEILEEVDGDDFEAVFVDFHAEASSEKYAMGFYLDGRVSAVVGTHTHVPTADARILENDTAFMCDVGMTGALDSVIGVNKELVIESFLKQIPVKFEPETEGRMVLNAVLIELDEKNGKALNVKHIQKIKNS